MLMNACGVPQDHIAKCLRYGVMSPWYLHLELHLQALPKEEEDIARAEGYKQLHEGQFISEEFRLLPAETDHIEAVSDAPCTFWVWITGVFGRIAEDNRFPMLAGPSFSLCMSTTLSGLDNIYKVRTSISVQAPYIYVQMLAALVHINNMVCALSFGLTAGASMGTLLAAHGVHPLTSKEATHVKATEDVQSIMVSFVLNCFGPLIYQALLEVGIAIAQPFSNDDAVVPTHRMLLTLENELIEGAEAIRMTRYPNEKHEENMPRRDSTHSHGYLEEQHLEQTASADDGDAD